ncbi:disease resistance protein RPV1-like [Hevea brasiliensis]|uniref:disease resistance protein RPV1-like n=1 Tax=Hevea brasiliensis TaxID=3981 RepID=UPI0025E2F592|nr:disease resistance protein RPV1-like [Hevea brasiliensis]
MDSQFEKMRLCINIKELNNVKTVGICGMGGIGKTTIASVIFKEMQCQFEGSAFLADVRETSRKYGLITLQRRLLCATLMERDIDVYDVYNGVYHIKNRLSRKKVLVILDDVDELEQLELLVVRKDENWFGVGSRIIITTRDEHLLIQHEVDQIYRVEELNHHEALQLFCLKAFKKDCPPQDYMELSNKAVNYAGGLPLALNVLGSSLYARSVKEWSSALKKLKEIPNEKILRKMKRYLMKVLESSGLYPDIGIRELIDKSLITISDNCVWMHDLLEEMGQEIVHRECREEPGRRSRLLLYKDVCHIFMNDTGTNLIEGVVLDYMFDQGERYMSSKAFLKMKALRLLILFNLNLSKDIEYLSNELRYLEWSGYPFKSLPQTFQPDQLAELHLSYSRIEQLWKGVRPLKLLKIIDLSYSKTLIKTPDFREIPYLEELILECSLPSSLCNLKSLKVFRLTGCSNLEELPDNIGDMTSLDVFEIAGIGSTSLPLAQPWDCLCPWWPMPKKPTPAMSFELPSLREYLDLSGNDFVSMPESISQLSKLLALSFSNCKWIRSFPNNLSSGLKHLSMVGCSCLETSLTTSISRNFKLENLHFVDCKKLQSLRDLSSTILQLSAECLTTQESIPNPFEANTSRTSSCTLIKWGLFSSSTLISLCLASSEVPVWFNNQGSGSSLEVQLPPYWLNYGRGGFCLSGVFRFHHDQPPSVDTWTVVCDLHAYNLPSEQSLFLGRFTMEIAQDLCITSDQLWFSFVPSSSITCLDQLEGCNQLKASFFSDQLEVKNCGLRLIYYEDEDVRELMSCDNPFEDLGLPGITIAEIFAFIYRC